MTDQHKALEHTGLTGDVISEMNLVIPGFDTEFNDFVISRKIAIDQLPQLKKIELVEAYLFSRSDSVGADFFPVNHRLTKDFYVREFFLPKGFMVVGKVHKDDHFLVCTLGDCTMTTQDGSFRIQPHYIEEAKSGTKRIVFAHEDTVLTTFHKVEADMKTIDNIENQIAEMSDLEWVNDGLMISGGEVCQL